VFITEKLGETAPLSILRRGFMLSDLTPSVVWSRTIISL